MEVYPPHMKKRLDVLLVERGLADSRTQAQALVLAGLVPGHDKPGEQVDETAELELKRRPPYVSRGGEKLAHALDAFELDPAGLDCLDVGSSTGGFTDVLLQRGAARVIAVVDSGLPGPKGNRELFLHLAQANSPTLPDDLDEQIAAAVQA